MTKFTKDVEIDKRLKNGYAVQLKELEAQRKF